MKAYRYKWTRHYGVGAQIAGEIIQRCKDDEAIVSAAAPVSSPLHAEFDWDDTSAARAHRLHQARQMRCSLVVEVITKDREPSHVRAFVRTVDRVGFVPTLEANEDELSEAEHRCWMQMKAFRARWKGLQFAREVVDAIAAKDRSLSRSRRKAAS